MIAGRNARSELFMLVFFAINRAQHKAYNTNESNFKSNSKYNSCPTCIVHQFCLYYETKQINVAFEMPDAQNALNINRVCKMCCVPINEINVFRRRIFYPCAQKDVIEIM